MRRDRPVSMIGSLESTTVRVSPSWRGRGRSNDLICHINVTGLLAVLYVLLIVFMVKDPVCSFSIRSAPVDLAKASSGLPMPGADREDALVVAVERDGKVVLGTEILRADALPGRIQEGIRHGSENRVYIKADARARYGDVKLVLDEVRASGVGSIAFLTEQRHPAAGQ